MMWLINPATAFPDPLFRIVWLLELAVLLVLIIAAMRLTRRAWISAAILFVIGLGSTLPGWIYQMVHPDYIGALIDIPLLLMFPLMAVSFVWAVTAWVLRWWSNRQDGEHKVKPASQS